MCSAEELATLAHGIHERGLLDSIVLHEGRVLDGRNRQRACEIAGVEPRYVTWGGQGGSPMAYVLDKNLHRRHLSPSQRGVIAAEALPIFEEEAKERAQEAQRRSAETTNTKLGRSVAIVPPTDPAPPRRKARDDAAKAANVCARYVQDAKRLKEKAPDLVEEVRAGAKTLPKAVAEAKARTAPRASPRVRPEPTTEPDEPIAMTATVDPDALAKLINLLIQAIGLTARLSAPWAAEALNSLKAAHAFAERERMNTPRKP